MTWITRLRLRLTKKWYCSYCRDRMETAIDPMTGRRWAALDGPSGIALIVLACGHRLVISGIGTYIPKDDDDFRQAFLRVKDEWDGGMRDVPARSLQGHLYRPYLGRIIRTRLFGEPYVELGPFIDVVTFLYVMGAVLGRALRDRGQTLFTLFSQPGRERDVLECFRGDAQKRLDAYGKKPDSFIDLVKATEYAKAGVHYPPRDRRGWKEFLAAAKKKIPLEDAELMAGSLFLPEGIAFGVAFPEVTEKLYRSTLEEIDMTAWRIPERPQPVTLKEFERDVLADVTQYLSTRHPYLLGRLGL